jgi:integrase
MDARAKAAEKRALVARGVDPIEQAAATRASEIEAACRPRGMTFEQAAEDYMATKLKRLRNEVHRRQWRYSLETFAYPVIGLMPVAEITTQDVLKVLRPIWETKCETASRLRGRIERILARATVEGHRTGANPATWRGHLQEALPSRSEVAPVVHHPAMDFADVPAFMAELCQRNEVGAAALRYLILTVSRTGETIGARWPEIDRQARTWTIPPERSKTGKAHIVPLSTGALAVLREMEPLRDVGSGFIFPGIKGAGLSQMTLLALLQRRMKRDVTCHGFRSAFRDWCGDEAEVPRELAEASLAHTLPDATERAYRRRTAVEKRRKVMQAWCDYCTGGPATIVDIANARREVTAAA